MASIPYVTISPLAKTVGIEGVMGAVTLLTNSWSSATTLERVNMALNVAGNVAGIALETSAGNNVTGLSLPFHRFLLKVGVAFARSASPASPRCSQRPL